MESWTDPKKDKRQLKDSFEQGEEVKKKKKSADRFLPLTAYSFFFMHLGASLAFSMLAVANHGRTELFRSPFLDRGCKSPVRMTRKKGT